MAIRSPRHGIGVAKRMSERARAQREAEQPAAEAPDIGGIFGGLRGLIDQLTKVTKEAGHTVELGGGKTKMVFGYTVRMGEDGIEAEPFGSVATESAPGAAAALQPITEVFADGDAIVVVAELPGADADGIVCRADGARLVIEASGGRRYRKEVKLPCPVSAHGIGQSYRNGILEVRMAKVPA
jgi:HSP20 family molecular chaperone IbpA